MAQGKPIGEFSLKLASTTHTPGPGNTIAIQANFEGPVTGMMAGLHRGTLSAVIVPGAKSGTYTYCGVTYPTNGDPVALSSQGTVETIGNHKRRLRGVNHFSDGTIAAVEAEGDITAGTLIGTLYELT
jgi:hypothetical protein